MDKTYFQSTLVHSYMLYVSNQQRLQVEQPCNRKSRNVTLEEKLEQQDPHNLSGIGIWGKKIFYNLTEQ